MSLNSIIADELRERAVFLARYDATMRNKMIALLKQLERDVVRRMMDLDEFGELTAAGRQRMEAIIGWTRSTIANAYKGLNEASVEQLVNLARNEVAFIEKTMNKGVGVQLLDTSVTPAGLAEIVSNTMIRGNPMEEWWAGQAVDVGRKFAAEMRLGMAAGETLSQLVQRVRGTAANGFSDGIMQTATRNAAALVRTAVQSVSNNTRMKVYKENEDVIGSLQHVSTLDDRTSDVCKARDGLRWKLNGEPIGHDFKFDQPPLHWNCRSTLIPVTKTWREMGFDVDELNPAQRASMDGAVPADMTYEQWLKGKGEAFQDRVLGQEKAQMWRDGEISFRDLVDQTGRPLTLEELQDKATERDLVDDVPGEGVSSSDPRAPSQSQPFENERPDEGRDEVIIRPDGALKWAGEEASPLPESETLAPYGSGSPMSNYHSRLPDFVPAGPEVAAYVENYQSINDAFYANEKLASTPSKWPKEAKAIDALFTPTSRDYTSFRSAETVMEGNVGDVVQLPAFTSTSRSADSAVKNFGPDGKYTRDPFGGMTLLEVQTPQGTKALVTNADEAELLLPPGTRLQILERMEDVKFYDANWGEHQYDVFIKAKVVGK